MTKVAKLISFLFHPILMPLLGVLIIFNSGIYQTDIPFEIKKFTYLMVTLFSIVIPMVLISLLLYWNMIQDIELSERLDRFIPMIFSSISLVVLHLILHKIIPIKLINAFTLAMVIIALVYLLSNFLLKTSLHLIALGGITGLVAVITKVFIVDLFIWLTIVIVVSGIVASSRIFLKAHTLTEIFSGYLTGFMGVFCTIYFFV